MVEPLREYVAATEKYSSTVKLGPNGELLNYLAGRPFPNFDRNDPQSGPKSGMEFLLAVVGR